MGTPKFLLPFDGGTTDRAYCPQSGKSTSRDKVKMRIVSEAELRGVDPEGLSFININTPEDYQNALRCWRSQWVFSPSFQGTLRRFPWVRSCMAVLRLTY